ncbi:MAG: asparaginase [Armatimonadota bacterium]|nr:asparaginase [Armatimonadota bacterium]MCX7778527.1 asparaginase [Armatimonadota bacterium]MDW8026673.1 asparaginase [Armatimonadota bacterium]
MKQPIKVEAIRGRIVEASHIVHAIALGEDGSVVVSFGDVDLMTYWRSAAKPFQAIALVATGAAEAFKLTLKELAIACGSHSGSAEHVSLVKMMLSKAGLTEAYLKNGTHEPFDAVERERLIRSGEKPSSLHSNCSGKHAAMLIASKHIGAPLETYIEPTHPIQCLIAQVLIEATGCNDLPDTLVPDGCGAPNWASPLNSIALAFHRFATGKLSLKDATARLFDAMAQHPDMIAAKGHWNTRIIEATRGEFIGKGGAEGLFAGAFRNGRSIAIKVQDGNHRPLPIVVVTLFKQLGWLSDGEIVELADFERTPLKNLRGEIVGEMRVVIP